ncbi:MAG TPA: alanine racemase [Usitatibacter sp.]|nr:alanine racemase [Usitatibacter sp.]
MARPTFARIEPSALRHNYWMAKRAAPRSRVYAVVKADAYGHGCDRVARALAQADGFATLELESAVGLRERHITSPVLLLEGFFEPAELAIIGSSSVATVVHSPEQLRMLELEKPARMLDVWLKINTGMNRLGFAPDKAAGALERLRASGTAKSITLMTHFATSDAPPGVSQAVERFNAATRMLQLPRSLANTGAIFGHPESHADIVRLGIGLYGATPYADRSARALGLKPVMTLGSRLIAIQELRAGDTVGYGETFRAERAMRIGVVACGYADGYPRHAPSGTPVLVAGARTRTVGRVSMDMITVDLAPVPAAEVGSPVVLWGEGLPVDEVAMAAGTVGYELLCALARRVPVVESDAP